MSLTVEDITADIPCPWYKCNHVLSRLQFKYHCDKHREDIATQSIDYQNNSEMLITNNCDIPEKRSESLTQRMLSATSQPNSGYVEDNCKLKTEEFSHLLIIFKSSNIILKSHAHIHNTCDKDLTYNYDDKSYHETAKSNLKKIYIKLKKLKQSNKERVKHVYDECSYQVTQKGHLKTHKSAVHEGVKYNSDECSHQATQKGDLKKHKSSVHEGVRYSCDKCSHQTTTKCNLNRHMRTAHEGVKCSCDKCSYSATSNCNLKKHNQSAHEDVKYSCDKCSYSATSNCNLKKHIQSAHEGVKYNCDKCFYQATQKGHLKTHKSAVHEGVKYNCDECSHQATQKGDLKKHKSSVHEGVRYSCDKCSYETTTKFNLNKHIRTAHEGVKNSCDLDTCLETYMVCEGSGTWLCSVCGNRGRKTDVRRHVEARHMTGTSVTCNICGESRKTRDSLRKHMKLEHSDNI